jgi:beta-fructofuranosidase
MSLRLADKWVWDFWLAYDGPDIHIFYLQADRTLPDPELRHWNVSIGHAVSQDMRQWTVLPDALAPSRSPAWDDYSTWTGSVIKNQGQWYLFYTGTSRAEDGKIQRVGLATSADLITWQKHPANPIIEADPRWYELLDSGTWHDLAWRDPWVFRHPESGQFHAFITARTHSGPPDARGVIGHARSTDLIQWEVQPPLSAPGDFGQLEVPQLTHVNGRYYLLFCTISTTHAANWQQRTGLVPLTGIHYLVGDNPLGPFTLTTPHFLVADEIGSHFAGKLVQDPTGGLALLTWRMNDPDGNFIGELADPLPVTLDERGGLGLT